MTELSMEEKILLQMYDNAMREIAAVSKELTKLENLPKGSIVKKNISGKDYMYLQWREGGKVKCQYLTDEEARKLEPLMLKRTEQRKILKKAKLEKKSIEKILGKGLLDEYFLRKRIRNGAEKRNNFDAVRNDARADMSE